MYLHGNLGGGWREQPEEESLKITDQTGFFSSVPSRLWNSLAHEVHQAPLFFNFCRFVKIFVQWNAFSISSPSLDNVSVCTTDFLLLLTVGFYYRFIIHYYCNKFQFTVFFGWFSFILLFLVMFMYFSSVQQCLYFLIMQATLADIYNRKVGYKFSKTNKQKSIPWSCLQSSVASTNECSLIATAQKSKTLATHHINSFKMEMREVQ